VSKLLLLQLSIFGAGVAAPNYKLIQLVPRYCPFDETFTSVKYAHNGTNKMFDLFVSMVRARDYLQ
jgi:hypothetical protein